MHLECSVSDLHPIDGRISDFDVGVLAGYPGWDAVATDHPELARARLEDPIRFRPPGGESGADVLARARDFLDERKAADRDALVVCHGVINKFIRAAARGITGGDIIALGEDQEVVYRLAGAVETELKSEPGGQCSIAGAAANHIAPRIDGEIPVAKSHTEEAHVVITVGRRDPSRARLSDSTASTIRTDSGRSTSASLSSSRVR